MARNAHIRSEHVEAIVNAIYTWDRGKPSWDDICRVAKPILGYLPTRSGLSAHVDIQAAFSSRKKSLCTKPPGKTLVIRTPTDAARMLAARDSEILTLKQQISAFRDKFDRWRYNAMLENVSIEKLDKPLPPSQTEESR